MYEECINAKRGCVECKQQLADGINRALAPFRQRRQELAGRTGYVEGVLADGAARARAIARETLAEAREKMGLPAPYGD